MNKWSIMARKRIKNETETDDLDEDEKKSKSKAKTKKDKSLVGLPNYLSTLALLNKLRCHAHF